MVDRASVGHRAIGEQPPAGLPAGSCAFDQLGLAGTKAIQWTDGRNWLGQNLNQLLAFRSAPLCAGCSVLNKELIGGGCVEVGANILVGTVSVTKVDDRIGHRSIEGVGEFFVGADEVGSRKVKVRIWQDRSRPYTAVKATSIGVEDKGEGSGFVEGYGDGVALEAAAV
jgi:hypothetical protein